jgi:hypothetical protein
MRRNLTMLRRLANLKEGLRVVPEVVASGMEGASEEGCTSPQCQMALV